MTCEVSEVLERKKKKTLKYKKQWGYNEEVAASPRVAAYRDLTPHTVEPSQALVTLNGFVTLVTLGGAVPFHPEMMHYLRRDGEAAYKGGERRDERNVVQKKQDVYKGTSDTTIKERERKQEEEKKQTEAKQMMPSVFKPPHSGN